MINGLDKIRVMWLLNHRAARYYDLEMLRRLEINEIFLPKSFPYDEGNLSGDIDCSVDGSLSIPSDELSLLNGVDWYNSIPIDPTVWEIANRYFKIVICGAFPNQIDSVTRHFQGTIVMRCFGLASGNSYSNILYDNLGVSGVERIRKLGTRFWFGEAYPHLHEIEHEFLRKRRCYLPLGLFDATLRGDWQGTDARI